MKTQHLQAGLAIVAMLAANHAFAADTLVDAVKSGNVSEARALLARSPDVNAAEADGTTALHWAVRAGQADLVRLLLNAKANVRAANRYGVTPIALAAVNGDAAMIETLLRAGADPNTALPNGETVLMTAARTGSVGAMKALVAKGANVHAKESRRGETALIWAASQGHVDAVRLLLEVGARVDDRSAETTYPTLVGPLQRPDGRRCAGGQGLQTTCLSRGEWTPLMYASREGAIDVVKALADGGANMDAADWDGSTPLLLAILNGHYDTAAALLEKGAKPNVADRYGMTPLYTAVNMNTLPRVIGRPAPRPNDALDPLGLGKVLLERGADPNLALNAAMRHRNHAASDRSLGAGTTPFMRAAKAGDVQAMRLLVEHGANPSLTQKNGTTALMIAAQFKSARNDDDGDGAAETGSSDSALAAIKLCLEKGSDINAMNENGDTALHLAANEAVIRFLVKQGADLDARNWGGETALEAWDGRRDRDNRLIRPDTVAVLRELTDAQGQRKP
jgi:ankyrin repeat protein